jgi:hypothetical protein
MELPYTNPKAREKENSIATQHRVIFLSSGPEKSEDEQDSPSEDLHFY